MTTRTIPRWWPILLALLAPAVARASAADAFESKVKPVSGQLYRKAGQLELTIPAAVLSMNDAFFSKYMLGAKLTYHLSEQFSLGISAELGTTSPTGSTTVCPANQGCRPAYDWELYRVPGQIRWITAAEVGFSPVYGKLNLFAEKALHFDLSLLGGVDLVSSRQVDPTATSASAKPGDAVSVGGHIGVGGRIFFAGFMALRVEFRDVLYAAQMAPAAPGGKSQSGNLQNQLMADLGLSFFIPLTHGAE